MVFDISQVDKSIENIIKEAVGTSKKSVSNYYGYNVCAILIDEEGNKFKGINFEPSNGKSICAETGALASYLMSDRKKIKALFVYGTPVGKDKKEDVFCFPCGSCRQMLSDFLDSETIVYGINETATKINTVLLEELLPYSFGAKNLE
ncbi:MAG: cytidine deaminase [Clostridia bacterium]|nr:cytidine deaminase [Clostridia bacterium]